VATFLDTAAAIKQVQADVGIPAEGTVFFGRSAGGWLAANIAQAHGDLVAAVYAEVPYVDVLATTSNPKLPLTQLEYDEFGDPVHRPAERAALARISPVDTVPAGGPTSPLVVVRTGLHDAQVFPYEALKWSRALRAAGHPRVYVGIDHDGGHFAGPDVVLQQRAEDAALLDSAVQGPRARRQTRKNTHRT
jgi:oligopeptidase B